MDDPIPPHYHGVFVSSFPLTALRQGPLSPEGPLAQGTPYFVAAVIIMINKHVGSSAFSTQHHITF